MKRMKIYGNYSYDIPEHGKIMCNDWDSYADPSGEKIALKFIFTLLNSLTAYGG
jgi:hypothetical protein